MPPPAVEIACDIFSGDAVVATREIGKGFSVRFRREPTNAPQFLGVELFCVPGYMMGLANAPEEKQAMFRKGVFHCEACVSEITTEVFKKRGRPRKSPLAEVKP